VRRAQSPGRARSAPACRCGSSRRWDSTGRRNILMVEVLLGRPAGWMTELTGRGPMSSPGAPSHRRGIEREFRKEITKGLLPEEAAHAVGAWQAVGSKWFRHGGGMSPFDLKAFSGRHQTFAERKEIPLLKAQETRVREIARRSVARPRRSAENCAATPPLAEGSSRSGGSQASVRGCYDRFTSRVAWRRHDHRCVARRQGRRRLPRRPWRVTCRRRAVLGPDRAHRPR
jgi:hypothetical protein